MKMDRQDTLTRREFLAGAGGFATGAAVGAVLGGGILDLVPAKAAAKDTPTWPWPYVQLDPEVARRQAYELYFDGGWGKGAAGALILQLQEKIGYPYTVLTPDMYRFGGGGVGGWATLCGAPMAAAAAINLVVPAADVGKLAGELLGWYCDEPLPSKKLDAISKYPNQTQSVAGSPLCHISTTKWCVASRNKEGSPQRKERCGKLTGDVAAQAVQMLNAYFAGTFKPVYKVSAATEGCMSCHIGPDSMLQNSYGKMDCTPCHGDPHRK